MVLVTALLAARRRKPAESTRVATGVARPHASAGWPWAGIENIEERVDGAARFDPVVLDELRRLAAADTTTPKREEQRDG